MQLMLDWKGGVQTALATAVGSSLVFKTWYTTPVPETQHFFDRSGQTATLVHAVIDDATAGPEKYDEEALPFFRIRFADGFELDAGPEELTTNDLNGQALIDKVCRGFAEARELGFCGVEDLAFAGDIQTKAKFLNAIA